MRRLPVSFILAALLLLLSTRPLQAAPLRDDQVVLGDDLTLHNGEQVDGDLVVIGGQLTMRPGSRVTGSVTVLGGRVQIDGVVNRELIALGGDVTLGDQARVQGDVVALGGRVQQAPGAQTGHLIQGVNITRAEFWRNLRLPLSLSRTWNVVGSLAGALVTALLGMAIVTFWPTQTAQVGQTILTAPLPSLGVGCALYPLAVSLTVFVLITLCLAPFAPVVILLLATANLFGWIALGTLWGRWLVRRARWLRATPLSMAGVGVFALTLVTLATGVVPVLGPLLALGAACIGLGAVALSRFGTARYRGRSTTET